MDIKNIIRNEYGSVGFFSRKTGINRNTIYSAIKAGGFKIITRNRLLKMNIDPETLKPICRHCNHVCY